MALQWLSLIGTIWLQAVNGTNTNFPAYSSRLKQLLSMSQLQLNNLAFASDAGKLLGWFSGIAAAYLPLWLVLLIGSTLGLIGYGVQYLFLVNQISSLSYWHVLLLTVLAGNSICWINTVCYLITIQNFPLDRQIAVGLSTSYSGLSAKIYTDIVDVFHGPASSHERAKNYLLLNSVLPLLTCVVTSPIVRDINVAKSRKLAGGFVVMFVITIATGVYSIVSSLESSMSRMLPRLMRLIGTVMLLLLPVMVPVGVKIRENLQGKCVIRKDARIHDLGAVPEEALKVMEVSDMETGGEEFEEGKYDGIDVEEEVEAREMMKRVDFWIYFFVYLFGATLGMVYMNNLAQIAESRGCSKTSSLVSLSSSFGFFGRLFPSLLDYFFSKNKNMVSRPALIAAMMAPMSGAFFFLLNSGNLSLYISTAIIGVCTGAITSIAVYTTTELFGIKHFGINHNILVTNIPIGSFLFGDSAALVYKYYSSSGDGGNCEGLNCYQTTFIIWGSLCFCGTWLAYLLHARTHKLYGQN